MFKCDGCGKYRKNEDYIGGAEWSECVHCCSDADLERSGKQTKTESEVK